MGRGIIAGALAGGAEALGSMARGHIEDERRVNLQREMSAIDEQRQMRIMEAQQRAQQKSREWELSEGARMGRENKVADAEAMLPVEERRARTAADIEVDKQERAPFNLGEGQERYVGGKKVASKGKTYAPGTAADAELSRMKLEDAREFRRLRQELMTASPDRAAEIERAMRIIAGKSENEYDVEKVTETRYDDAGNEIKTERTQRRKPPASAPAKGANAAPKMPIVGEVVEGYRFMGGNPRDPSSWQPASRSAAGKVE